MQNFLTHYKVAIIALLFLFTINVILVRDNFVQKGNVVVSLLQFDNSSKSAADFAKLTNTLKKVSGTSEDNIAAVVKYHEKASQSGQIIPWPTMTIENIEIAQKEIPFETKVNEQAALPSTIELVTQQGKSGKQEEYAFKISYLGKSSNVAGVQGKMVEESQAKVVYKGTSESLDFVKKAEELLAEISTTVKNNEREKFFKKFEMPEVDLFDKLTRVIELDHKFATVKVKEVKVTDLPEINAEGKLLIGTATLAQDGCGNTPKVSLYFSPVDNTYQFGTGFARAFDFLCVKAGSHAILSCTDCKFAPVGSKRKLPSTYVPPVVETGLTGGGTLIPEARDAMKQLFAAAVNAQGTKLKIQVKWGYRSYKLQETLFNEYVEGVLKQYGVPREEAIRRTKERVAPPGESEHQLGTVADIECADCNDSNKIFRNSEIYMFLNRNAHNYGFIVSFTQSCQAYTGIIYEPWHIRYVGKEFATEMFNRDYLSCKNGLHVGSFLEEKGLY